MKIVFLSVVILLNTCTWSTKVRGVVYMNIKDSTKTPVMVPLDKTLTYVADYRPIKGVKIYSKRLNASAYISSKEWNKQIAKLDMEKVDWNEQFGYGITDKNGCFYSQKGTWDRSTYIAIFKLVTPDKSIYYTHVFVERKDNFVKIILPYNEKLLGNVEEVERFETEEECDFDYDYVRKNLGGKD